MAAKISGQTTVTVAGTAVPLGTEQVMGLVIIKALDTNTGVITIGNNGSNDVTTSTDHRLLANQQAIMFIGNMADVYVDSAVNGEGVSWLKLNV